MLRAKLNLKGAEYERVAGALFAYLFRRFNKKEFASYVDDVKLVRTITRKVLERDGYVLKNCKLFAYAHWYALKFNRTPPRPRDFGVTLRDAQLLRRINLSHLKGKDVCPPMSLEEFEQQTTAAIYGKETGVYLGKFISRKMSFLIKSYGIDRGDIEEELRSEALRGLYKQYPYFASEAHLRATARTVLKREGQTFIKFHTRKSRTRLQDNGFGGNEQTTLPLEAAAELATDTRQADATKETLQALVALAPKLGPVAQRFLLVSAGHYDEEFSTYLGQDNRDAVERLSYTFYVKKLQTFLAVPDHRVQSLYRWLQPRLG